MDDRESTRHTPSHAAGNAAQHNLAHSIPVVDNDDYLSSEQSGATFSGNDDLLQGTGSIPLAASSTGSMPSMPSADSEGPSFSTASAPSAPRYVRKRTPHRSQGTLDDLNEDSESSATYTHDSNISVGGATPLSGMQYRRARSNMSRVKGSRYGQYLEIPKGRRSIFASRERARRRNSVLALFAVIILLVLAAMVIWNMMQNVLN
jgi:hypothetical protein